MTITPGDEVMDVGSADEMLDPAAVRVEPAPPRTSFWRRLPTLTVLVIAVLGALSYAAIYPHFLNPKVYPIIRSDGAGYYSYLPAYLVERDPTFKTFVAHDLHGATTYETGLVKNARTGNYLQRYPVGEAVMMAPFFAVGHWLALIMGKHADGFSNIEQRASGAAALVYMIAGLLILSTSLRRYFGSIVVSAALVSIVFGTSLFHYATFDSSFSHAFSFFLVAALIELVHRWYERPTSFNRAIWLGVVIGLIVLVRQSNAVLILIVPLFGVTRWADIRPRVSFLWERRLQLLAMAEVAVVVFLPQAIIWHEATGKWLVNSYTGQGVWFQFGHPEIVKALFSVNPHGLLPWAPLLVLAFIGFVFMRRYARELLLPLALVAVLNVYVIASWSNWFYGGGYGHRAFVDTLPIMAFPLASLYASLRSLAARVSVAAIAVIFCSITTIQMVHYWQLRIPFAGASWHQYFHLLSTGL